MCLSPDGTKLAALHLSGTLSLWHLPSLRHQHMWHTEEQVRFVGLSQASWGFLSSLNIRAFWGFVGSFWALWTIGLSGLLQNKGFLGSFWIFLGLSKNFGPQGLCGLLQNKGFGELSGFFLGLSGHFGPQGLCRHSVGFSGWFLGSFSHISVVVCSQWWRTQRLKLNFINRTPRIRLNKVCVLHCATL